MNEPLRPSTLGEILDRTAQLYRSRFLLFLGISVFPTGVIVVLACLAGLVVAWWSAAGAGSVPEAAGYILVAVFAIGVALVALPILLAATALASAAMNHAVSRVHLGQTTTIRDAYKSVWRRGWRYIGLYLLEGLIIGAAPIAAWIVLLLLFAGVAALAGSAGAGNAAGGALFGLLIFPVFIAVIGYIIWMLLRLSLAFPACVVEQIGAWPAVKRSSNLSHGTKGRIFVLYLLGAVLSWLLSMGITLPLIIILTLIPGMNNPQNVGAVAWVPFFIIYGSSFAVQALVRPVYGIALVLFYYDQRIRQEGFDIEWMMQQAGMVVAPQATPQAAPRPAAARGLVADPGNPFVPALEPPQDVEFPQAIKPTSPTSGESQ
jgi:uncharacterized membrane protein